MTFTRRQVEIRLMLGDALQARATHERSRNLRYVSAVPVSVAIAVFAAFYFLAQLVRGAL